MLWGRRQLLTSPAWAALAAAGLTGCSTTIIRRRVERHLERRLGDWIGPAEQYRVRISETRDAQLVLGDARRVEIEGRKIRAQGQFLIDSLKLTLQGLHYSGEEPYFVSVERTELELELTEAAVNDYLRQHQARYQPQLALSPGSLRVRMTYPFLGKPTLIDATGRLVIKDGLQLLFDAEQADVSFLNSPRFGERFVEDRVNPLIDLGRLKFPARLESVELLAGRIRARGVAVIPRDLGSRPDDD